MEMQELGYNYRITDIQAALGVSQTKRLGIFIKRRYEIADIYDKNITNIPLIKPKLDNNSAWHLYVIRLDEKTNISRLELFNKMHSANIGVNVHYIPIYNQPYYKKMGFKEGYCPNAEGFYQSCLSIPIFPKMTSVEQNYVIDKLKEFII
jgi:dTDP-4-amino-4,6-dideoxygalactose transaminase